jgi:hypothetical protein
MRTSAILLLIVLATSAVSAQSMVKTTAKAPAASGSAGAKTTVKGSTGVKATVKVPTVKATVKVPTVKATVKVPTVKATVKVPTVKATVGGSIGGSSKTNTHQVSSGKASTGVSGGASIKVKLPSVSIGGSASTKTGATVDLKGSCPQAKTMGFVASAKPVASAGLNLKFCTSLASTCCTPESINTYGDSWVKYTKDLSHAMWSIAKTSTAAANLISNLKTGFGDAARVPAKAAAKRILQSMVAKAPAAKASATGSAKAPAAKASATGSAKGSVGVKATVKVPTVKATVKVPTVKATVKVPTVKATVKVPTVKATVGGSVGGSTKTITHSVSSGKTSGSLKIGGSTKTTGKATIKISVGSSSKASSGPNTWNASNSTNQALFATAWNYTIKYSQYGQTVFNHAQACYKAILNLKASLACAACDNKNAANFATDSVTVTAADTRDVETECSAFAAFDVYTNNMVRSIVLYVGTASGNAAVLKTSNDDVAAMDAIPARDWTGCVKNVAVPTKRRLQAVVPVTPAKKPETPVTPAVATTVTATSWTSWKSETGSKASTDDLYTSDIASGKCLVNPGMVTGVNDLVYGKSTKNMMALANVTWKALGNAYDNAGTTEIITAWTSFKGKVILSSAATVKAAATTPAVKAAATTPAATTTAATKRRLQAPVPSSTPQMKTASTGIALKANYSKTGLTVPKDMEKDESQTQMASSKIAMFSAIAAFAMLFFN